MYAYPAFLSVFFGRIKKHLNSGLSPQKLALSITAGLLIGLFPFFFIPTLLAMAATFFLRCNFAVLMAFNYAAWPLQIILFVPYTRLGSFIFGANHPCVTLSSIAHNFSTNFTGALHSTFMVIAEAVCAWAISGLPAGLLLFYIIKMLANKVAAKIALRKGE